MVDTPNTGNEGKEYWILELAKPVCVNEKDELHYAESNQSKMQLINFDCYKYRKYLSKPVVVSGMLSHAITANEHTNLTLIVNKITNQKKP